MGFPMFKLATLLARQVSAPVAKRIKEYARGHPGAGRAACEAAAGWYRGAELRFKLWTLGLRQPRAVPALAGTAAIDAGADILGEVIVFALGSAIIIFEVNRQAAHQRDKKLALRSQWAALRLQLEELRVELLQQQRDLDRLQAALAALRDRDRDRNSDGAGQR